MDVDGPRRSVVIVSPDGIEKDVSCQDPSGIAQKMFEQAEFFCSEGDFNFLDGDFVSREIHDEIAIAIVSQTAIRFPFKTSKEGLDAGDQSLRAEGFGDIVVGSQFQAYDGVCFLGFGGQHDDGKQCGLRSRSKAFAHFEAVDAWQHQVENDQVRLLLFHLSEAFRAARRRYGPKALFFHVQFDQLENVVLILNDEDFLVCGG